MPIMNDFTGWRYYKGSDSTIIGIYFIHPTGKAEARLLIDHDVEKWLKAGGVPLPAL